MDGFLIIDKLAGVTSRDVVNQISRKFKTKKVGHTGTLDPFATGVMIVAINKGTKASTFIEELTKEYTATLVLGKETDTLDKEGKVILEKEVPLLDESKIKEAFSSFVGTIKQIPPMYSALKKDGVPLYKLAREGQEVERKEREIKVDSLDLISFSNNEITFKVVCSKGTYVRTLGKDIATKLGTCGYLKALRRDRVGKFSLEKAKKVEEVTEFDIISLSEALSHLDSTIVNEETKRKVLNGVKLQLDGNDLILIKDNFNQALAVYKKNEDGYYHSLRGLF